MTSEYAELSPHELGRIALCLGTENGFEPVRIAVAEQKIGKENELTSILIAALDRPAHSIIYVVDSDDTETYCPPGLVDDSMTDEEINDFVNSTAVITNTEEYGWLTSGAAPMYNEDGTLSGFVIIDISMNEVMHNKQEGVLVMHDFVHRDIYERSHA